MLLILSLLLTMNSKHGDRYMPISVKQSLVAQEAVAVAKANRRYWLEEICANVTPEGKLINTSSWKKSGKSTRKPAAKRKATASGTKAKRQRKQEQVPNEQPHIFQLHTTFLFRRHSQSCQMMQLEWRLCHRKCMQIQTIARIDRK